jgi:hypothetical protein
MVTKTQVFVAQDSETIGVSSIALLENGVEECGSLAVYAESLDLENDLNEAVGDREYEIDHRESRKCNALPLVRDFIQQNSNTCDWPSEYSSWFALPTPKRSFPIIRLLAMPPIHSDDCEFGRTKSFKFELTTLMMKTVVTSASGSSCWKSSITYDGKIRRDV